MRQQPEQPLTAFSVILAYAQALPAICSFPLLAQISQLVAWQASKVAGGLQTHWQEVTQQRQQQQQQVSWTVICHVACSMAAFIVQHQPAVPAICISMSAQAATPSRCKVKGP
jgi:hypothetical protein